MVFLEKEKEMIDVHVKTTQDLEISYLYGKIHKLRKAIIAAWSELKPHPDRVVNVANARTILEKVLDE